MRCAKCKQAITKNDQKKMHVKRSESGRLVAAYHFRCWHILNKVKFHEVTPTAYVMSQRHQTADDLTPTALAEEQLRSDRLAALRARQAVIEEERAKEPTPSAEDDWRDPETLEV